MTPAMFVLLAARNCLAALDAVCWVAFEAPRMLTRQPRVPHRRISRHTLRLIPPKR